MFDVFQNVLFGKKKSNSESEKEKSSSDVDDFVLVGQTSSEQHSTKEPDSNPSEPQFPKNPYSVPFGRGNLATASSKPEETYYQIMPLQDVPFIINSALFASAKLEQIWQGMAPIINSISHKPHREEYDFSLEKSVISETMQK